MTQAVEAEQKRRSERRPLYLDHNLQILFSVTLIGVMSVSSISPILPEVAGALGVSRNQVGFLVTAYTLPGIVLTPVLGVLSDRIGRKRVLAPSLFLFGIAGAAVAAAPTFGAMVALRLLQGVGGAALGTITVTTIGDLFAERERLEAMGYNSSMLSMGTAIWPALGGLLALLGWRLPFLMPVAAVPVGLLVLFSLRNPEPRSERGMSEYFANLRAAVKSWRVAGLLAATGVTFIMLYGARVTYLPLLIENAFGASTLVVGLILSSTSVATATTSWQLGRLSRRVNPTHLIAIAFGLYALAIVLIPLAPSLWLLVLPSLVFGVAQGLNLPNVFALLTGSVASENRGALLALNGMALRTGQTVGPVLMGTLAAGWSIDGAYYLMALLPVVMIFVVLFAIDR